MNISLIPVPGFEKTKVDPIPTPEIVPNPMDSVGLKYNSLFNLKLEFSTFLSGLNDKVLGFWEMREFAVWALPVVESCCLNTLILEDKESIFNKKKLYSYIKRYLNIGFTTIYIKLIEIIAKIVVIEIIY